MDTINKTSNDEILCHTARIILNTPGFPILLIAEIIFGVIASLLNILLLATIWSVSVFHSNLRLLLLHFSFNLLWYAADYAIKAAMLLPRTFGAGDPCDMKTDMFACRVQEIPFSIPVQIAVYAELSISLERLYSTVRHRKYSDNDGRNFPIVAMILIPLCYVVPTVNIVNSLLKMPESQMIAVCENLLSMTANSARTSLGNNLAALIASMICVSSVWYWNRYKLRAMMGNKAKHTLSSRFQIDQNIQINRIIVPDVVLQLCCYIPNYVFMFLAILELPVGYEVKTVMVHVNYLWKIVYALAHPIVCMTKNVHVRKRVKRILPSQCLRFFRLREEKNVVIAIVAKEVRPQKTHFHLLEEQWNKPSTRIN